MDISFIIVNWNTQHLLEACLHSIYDTVQDVTFEVIVVDNGSQDGSVSFLKDHFPSVQIVENFRNRGFGAANNQAFAIMKGRYALLLNTDALLTPHAAAQLFSFMELTPDASVACGQLLNADGTKQNSIAVAPSLVTLLFNAAVLEYLFPGRFPSKRYTHTKPIEIESAVGACIIVRRDAIDDIGPFDERYFFFFEETDWMRRMRNGGWKLYHVPSARIYHLQGQSIGPNIHSRMEFYRSRYQFLKKWNSTCYNALAVTVVFCRLTINLLSTTIGCAVTLWRKKNIRDKWHLYGQLFLWHLRGCPASYHGDRKEQ